MTYWGRDTVATAVWEMSEWNMCDTLFKGENNYNKATTTAAATTTATKTTTIDLLCRSGTDTIYFQRACGSRL